MLIFYLLFESRNFFNFALLWQLCFDKLLSKVWFSVLHSFMHISQLVLDMSYFRLDLFTCFVLVFWFGLNWLELFLEIVPLLGFCFQISFCNLKLPLKNRNLTFGVLTCFLPYLVKRSFKRLFHSAKSLFKNFDLCFQILNLQNLRLQLGSLYLLHLLWVGLLTKFLLQTLNFQHLGLDEFDSFLLGFILVHVVSRVILRVVWG